MGKHLVLVGGGHAHMVTLANLHDFIDKGHKVTVIGPSAFHYYSGMGPGMLGKTYAPEDIRGDYLLIFNMGDDTGILRKKRLVFGGRLAFLIKDHIDRKFIRKFQAIEQT